MEIISVFHKERGEKARSVSLSSVRFLSLLSLPLSLFSVGHFEFLPDPKKIRRLSFLTCWPKCIHLVLVSGKSWEYPLLVHVSPLYPPGPQISKVQHQSLDLSCKQEKEWIWDNTRRWYFVCANMNVRSTALTRGDKVRRRREVVARSFHNPWFAYLSSFLVFIPIKVSSLWPMVGRTVTMVTIQCLLWSGHPFIHGHT